MSADLLLEARHECLDALEWLGTLSGQIRASIGDAELGNLSGAAIVCDDALLALSELESALSKIGAGVAKFKQWAEEEP